MRTFREFVQEKSYDDIKLMVLNVLDPERNLNIDSQNILNQPLSDFKLSNKLLTTPNIIDMINSRNNRGAILQAIKNDTTTIGNLVSMLAHESSEEEPKYLG